MNIHKNACLTPLRREEMARYVVEGRLSKAVAARIYGVAPKVVARWIKRFRAEDSAGVADRSLRPKRGPRQTPAIIAKEILTLRRQRLTGKHIVKQTGVSTATVSRVLWRAGISRLKDIEPAEPMRRHERERPDELIHTNIKKLGRLNRVGCRIIGNRTGQPISRGVGWEFVLAYIDDTRASPSHRYCRTSARKPPLPFLWRLSLIVPAWASPSSAS